MKLENLPRRFRGEAAQRCGRKTLDRQTASVQNSSGELKSRWLIGSFSKPFSKELGVLGTRWLLPFKGTGYNWFIFSTMGDNFWGFLFNLTAHPASSEKDLSYKEKI